MTSVSSTIIVCWLPGGGFAGSSRVQVRCVVSQLQFPLFLWLLTASSIAERKTLC